MGANAVTTVPVYTAGEVLTAADLNITNSGIPVFATTVTRDAAFGGTGEKTLAEGQFAYIEATNTTQYYDGAAWQPVGITPGLVCVKAETSFSAAAAVNVDSVFTSSYTHYLVNFSLASSATNDIACYVRLRAASTDTSTGYYYAVSGATRAGSAIAVGADNATFFSLGDIGNITHLIPMTFGSPQVAARTSLYASSQEAATNTTANRGIQSFGGFLDNATQYDGFTVYPSSGTITGSYTVYGYSKTV
jgi:hypothetical protein